MKRLSIILLCILLAFSSKAQVSAADSSIAMFLPNIAYSFQWNAGDVAERYGYNSTLGGGFMYKTKKNFLLSFDANFIFGDQVNNVDSILRMVLTDAGYIIDGNGTYTQYNVSERGYSINFNFGKVINVASSNPNSGILLMGGIGYLVHRMRIDVQNETAPQITGDYALGYDRLTGGLSLNQFIGYFFAGKSKIFNFYAGFQIYEAFTKSKRDYIFDEMGKDNNHYQDFFYGFKVGWMIPVYKRAPDAYYYY